MIEQILSTVGSSLAVETGYFAIRLIKHLARSPFGYVVPEVPSEPSPQAQDLARTILKTIQDAEGLPIEELGSERASRYIHELADLVSVKMREGVGFDPDRGKALLDDLRRSS